MLNFTAVRYHTPDGMSIIKKTKNNKCENSMERPQELKNWNYHVT